MDFQTRKYGIQAGVGTSQKATEVNALDDEDDAEE